MQSLRKLVNKPRVDDWSPLAKFYYADEALNIVAGELDSFDGRRDPERCNQLVNKLRQCQDRVLQIIGEMLTTIYPRESDRASRDYRVKFPEDIVHENLPGQLWFGAECLAAGSNIIDHEFESEAIRPMARALTRHLDQLREMLKDQSLRNPAAYPDKIKTSLRVFDHLFAEFELSYVSAMVPVKSAKEYDAQLDVAVLFSESLERAIEKGYVTREQIEDCDPSVMITVPRLAIVCGLLIYPLGALNVERPADQLSEMFRPFQTLLGKIRDLLRILDETELDSLELALSSAERPAVESKATLTISDFRNKTNGQQSTTTTVPTTTTTVPTTTDDGDADSVDSNQEASTIIVGSPTTESVSAVIAVGPTDGGEPDVEITVRPVVDGIIGQQSEMDVGAATPAAKNTYEDDAATKRRKQLRSRFRSSEDLTHRLFVCIAGVADQLQTNYPSDLRKVLKMVLQPNEVVPVFEVSGQTAAVPENEEETGVEVREPLPLPPFVGVRWVPDQDCDQCTACEAPFTMVRRRHHCRNCGRIFCGRCSANSMQLPELGYDRKVRVCNLCFLYKLNPFSPGSETARSTTNEVNGSSEAVNRDDNGYDADDGPSSVHPQSSPNQTHLAMRTTTSSVIPSAQSDTNLPVA